MAMSTLRAVLFMLVVVSVFACKDKETIAPTDTDFGYDYFPLEIGKYWIYQIDSTIYDFGENDTQLITNSTTQVRERITDTLTDNLNRTVFRIERSERSTADDLWSITDIWVAVTEDEKAEKTEENLRFIKMVFPIAENQFWEGNRFIDETTIITVAGESLEIFKSWSSNVVSLDQAEQVGSFSFDRVLTISHADNENLIERRFAEEKYAHGVGLVARSMQILDTQCIADCEGQSWEEKAEKGFILKQTLLEHN